MPGAERGPLQQTESIRPQQVERLQHLFLRPEFDLAVYDRINDVRDQVEAPGGYRRLKEGAHAEIDQLPPDVIPRLMKRSAAVIEALPTTHSKGHLARDTVHLAELLHDPDVAGYDDVELVVGILGGTFHDIGNGIVDRSRERGMISLHAEVGAWLFDFLGKDTVPLNLRTLTQYAIASHTRFDHDRSVMIEGNEVVRHPYDTKIVEGTMRGAALTRATCRTDLQNGGIQPARHIPYAVRSGDIYLATGELRERLADRSANVAELFDREGKDGSILAYFRTVANNARTENRHTEGDTPYMKAMFADNVGDLDEFVDVVMSTEPPRITTDVQREAAARRFMDLCHLLEPGNDIDPVLAMLKEDLSLLNVGDYNYWADGFCALTDKIYPSYHKKMEKRVSVPPAFVDQRPPIIQRMVTDVVDCASGVVEAMDPRYLNEPRASHPDLMKVFAGLSQ